jgi:hypothetical protein
MKKLVLSLFILLVLSCAAAAQAARREWKIFSPPGGEWSIIAPGVLESETDPGKPTSRLVGYDYKDRTGFFAVIYRGVSKVPKNPKNYFDKTRDEAVKGVRGTLLKDEPFTNGDISGREILIQLEYGRMERARIFFSGKRVYTVLVILPAEEIRSEEINTFFNSFTAKQSN